MSYKSTTWNDVNHSFMYKEKNRKAALWNNFTTKKKVAAVHNVQPAKWMV